MAFGAGNVPLDLKVKNPRNFSGSAKKSKEKKEGRIDKLKNQMGGTADKILSAPQRIGDKYPDKPWVRKTADIGFSLLIIGAAIGLGFAFLGSGGLHSLANPSFMKLTIVPLVVGVGALGTSLLLQNVLGHKQRNVVAKVLAVAAPILIMGAAATLIALGIRNGGIGGIGNFNTIAGFLLLPAGALLAARFAIPALKQNDTPFLTSKMDRKADENLREMRQNPVLTLNRGGEGNGHIGNDDL